jgi:chromosome segregation ATPase
VILLPDRPFWPQSLNEWLEALGVALLWAGAVLGVVWKVLTRPIIDSIKDDRLQVERDKQDRDRIFEEVKGNLFELRTQSTSWIGRIDAIERKNDLAEMDRAQLHEDIGATQESLRTISDTLRRIEVGQGEQFSDVKERLVAVETQLKMSRTRNQRGE